MSSVADNGGKLGTYELIVGPAESPLGDTWIARAEVPGGSASEWVTVRRFGADLALSLQEIEVLSEAAGWALSVKQEGVVPTIDLVTAGQQLAWVRSYMLGEPLRRLLQHCTSKRQAPSIKVALRIVVDVLEALVPIAVRPRALASGALLNCGLLGPDVVWISSDGRSRITDVGVLAAAGSLDRFTKHPDLAAYRAPEQLGGSLTDPRSDVFVAGILLWELISGGRHLFAGRELGAVLRAVFASRVEAPVGPMPTNRQVDAGAVAVVMRALDRDPTRRFQGPQEMLQAIHDLGHEAVADRADVAAYMSTVSNDLLSSEREIVAQLMAGAGSPKPDAQQEPAAAGEARPSKVPLARSASPAKVTGSQPPRASSPPQNPIKNGGERDRSQLLPPRPEPSPARAWGEASVTGQLPSARKPHGTAAQRARLSSWPSANKSEARKVQSPRRSWPVSANRPQAAGSHPTPASQSSAPKPTGAGSKPAPPRPGTKLPAPSLRSSEQKALAPGIRPVTVFPRSSTNKALGAGSQSAAASSGTVRELAASAPLFGSEGPSGTSNEPIAVAAGAGQPTDTNSDPKAAALPSAAELSAAASTEATGIASPPASAGMTPSSAPAEEVPMPNISQSREGAPSDPSAADVPTAESEKRSAAEEARAIPHDSEPETAASPPEQGRSTLPGLAAETGTESEPAPSGRRREAAASGEKRSAPGPAAPADEEEPDITSGQGEAEVAAEPFLDEVTTRALKRRFPLGVVLAAAAIAAGGLYFWFGTGSASQHQVLPAKAEPHKSASTAAPALAEASTARAPESSSAAEPSEAAPTAAKDEKPTTPEPEAESSLKAKLTQKKSPASQYVAKRAKPKPTSQPEADKPAKVTKSAKAKKARRKRAAGSADSDKMSALDMLRRLDEKGN